MISADDDDVVVFVVVFTPSEKRPLYFVGDNSLCGGRTIPMEYKETRWCNPNYGENQIQTLALVSIFILCNSIRPACQILTLEVGYILIWRWA